ncbi:MAG TPA: hypothetical protein VGB13_04640 [Candidatus Krumholzibacteria bacterium]
MTQAALFSQEHTLALEGAVGEAVAELAPGGYMLIHRRVGRLFAPLAVTGITVTPWPSEENWPAKLILDQGAAVEHLRISIHQLQCRRVWPGIIFVDHAELRLRTEGLRTPITVRFLWEGILP